MNDSKDDLSYIEHSSGNMFNQLDDKDSFSQTLSNVDNINKINNTTTPDKVKPLQNNEDIELNVILSSNNKKKYNYICSCGNPKCRKNNKHSRYRCRDDCNKKDCKYCKILDKSPYHLGAQILIANEVEVNRANIKDLYINKYKLSEDRIREYKTYRYTCDNTLTERIFFLNQTNTIISLDNLNYFPSRVAPKGGLLKSICINNKNISDIIFSPTFYNKSLSIVQIEAVILISKIFKTTFNTSYTKLGKAFGTIEGNMKNTLNVYWKGPLPKTYKNLDSDIDIYLWFVVDSSHDIFSIEVLNDDDSDITLVY
jgi:hypothetical protein